MLKEMYHKWELHNGIYIYAGLLLNLVELNENLYHNGEVLEYYDYMDILLKESIPYDNDAIDAVLLFGDGTIEFHLRDDTEAFNWSVFDADILERVLTDLEKQVNEKANY